MNIDGPYCKDIMPAFDPIKYDSGEDSFEEKSSTPEFIESDFPYGLAGVMIMAVGLLIPVIPYISPLLAMFGCLMVLISPGICYAGYKKTKYKFWISCTTFITFIAASYVFLLWPYIMMSVYSSR